MVPSLRSQRPQGNVALLAHDVHVSYYKILEGSNIFNGGVAKIMEAHQCSTLLTLCFPTLALSKANQGKSLPDLL